MLKLMEQAMHGHVGLVRRQFGQRHLLTCRDLRGSFSGDSIPSNMSASLAQDDGSPVGLGHREFGQLIGRGAGQDGMEDVAHVTRR